MPSLPCFLCRTPQAKSLAEDLARLRRHVENEQPEAMKHLGDCYNNGDFGLVKSSKKAAKLYLRAAELGQVDAMVALGTLYETGGNGVKIDRKKAIKMFRTAADRGNALAQSNLSTFLSVDGQYMESFRYCKLAADQGYTQAQYNAGYCYENAEGVGRNLDEAKRLYALAAAKGDEHGIAALRRIGA
jgi:TPR repeat protein